MFPTPACFFVIFIIFVPSPVFYFQHSSTPTHQRTKSSPDPLGVSSLDGELLTLSVLISRQNKSNQFRCRAVKHYDVVRVGTGFEQERKVFVGGLGNGESKDYPSWHPTTSIWRN